VFGDPFQGAKIKGYNGEIVTFCNAGDNVCTGNFEVTASHLSYSTGSSISAFHRLSTAYFSRKGSGSPASAAPDANSGSSGEGIPKAPKRPSPKGKAGGGLV
jgi:hypothetical protein